ncbi:MAG: response regulator [Chloroflexi bacterium]|nr:response regulator [Chloroflexota bacterium]
MPETRAFIIDDEPGIVQLCERLLSRDGFEVASSIDPVEGITRLADESFDLLLVDIRMPQMDGFAVIERVRQNQPDIAVVIMTGFGTLETAMRALQQGADGLILKPFEEGKDLVKTVNQALVERQHKLEIARLQAIRPLLDMTETLFTETNYETLLDLILSAICGHLRSSHAAIYRKSVEDDAMHMIAGIGKPLPEEDAQKEEGVLARAYQWKTAIWVNRQGPDHSELQAALAEYDMGAVMCVPITRQDTDFLFLAGRDTGESAYQLADLDMFGILARQADVALENARLYSELRDYVRVIEESQQALIQTEKMAAVGRLTASIAHEVNNPLQAVQNCLHLAQREELSPEERQNYLDMARDEMERLMTTVRRMLDFYRPGALDREPVNVNDVLDVVLSLLEKQLSDNKVAVERQFGEDLPQVSVVRNQLQQVFFNLILNALGFMLDGGDLTISTQHNAPNLEIFFEDSGPGVSDEIREHLFEPFVSNSTDGTGLGLSVSYGILTAHGGSLDLLPGENGGGARFRVSLPLEEA